MDRISNERLAEMLSGLDGATPGPWEVVGSSITDWGREWECSMSMEFVPNGHDDGINSRSDADASHIARCDPDTMRSILTELQSLRSQPAGVRVKGLEWDGVLAVTPFCSYTVGDYGDDAEDWRFVRSEYPYADRSDDGYSTEIEAKAAAEADYRTRILSALEVDNG